MAQRRRSQQRFEPYPMTDVEGQGYMDFAQTGRTGRRNALADILEPNHGKTSTSSLPTDMEKLKCTDDDEDEASKSDTASALPKEGEEKEGQDSKDKSTDAKKTSSSEDKPQSKEEDS